MLHRTPREEATPFRSQDTGMPASGSQTATSPAMTHVSSKPSADSIVHASYVAHPPSSALASHAKSLASWSYGHGINSFAGQHRNRQCRTVHGFAVIRAFVHSSKADAPVIKAHDPAHTPHYSPACRAREASHAAASNFHPDSSLASILARVFGSKFSSNSCKEM